MLEGAKARTVNGGPGKGGKSCIYFEQTKTYGHSKGRGGGVPPVWRAEERGNGLLGE